MKLEKNVFSRLPKKLKLALEYLSGYSLDDVKVYYNSDQPKRINAKAYAKGSDIYLAPGEEEYLAHEAWHIVQQKQGRVCANNSVNGVEINDDAKLEKEATLMADKANQLIKKGFVACSNLLTINHFSSSIAQRTTVTEPDEISSPLIRIVSTKFDEASSERKKRFNKVETQQLSGLVELNKWLDPDEETLSDDDEIVENFLDIMRDKKPLPYYKYLKNEKTKFIEKWKILNTDNIKKTNLALVKNESDACFGTKSLGLSFDIEANEERVINKTFKVSRPVEALFYTPYLAMFPFTEEFNFFHPIPGKLGLRAIGINSKNKQIICATSAMASLCGYIKSTDNSAKANEGAINFMKATHKSGKQVNAASIETARGFAIGLASQQERIVSPIFKPLINERGFNDRDSANALNEFFWSTIYPNLKTNAAIYCYSGTGHVASFLKQDNDTFLWVESNNTSNKDRSVYVKQMSAATSSTRRHLGDGFLISEPK